MRKVQFCVPSPLVVEFCEEILNSNLNNSITGITEEDEIIIEVEYGKDESKVVDKLEELLDTLCEQLDDEEEEENEDDN